MTHFLVSIKLRSGVRIEEPFSETRFEDKLISIHNIFNSRNFLYLRYVIFDLFEETMNEMTMQLFYSNFPRKLSIKAKPLSNWLSINNHFKPNDRQKIFLGKFQHRKCSKMNF
jgi:hypothetical protein